VKTLRKHDAARRIANGNVPLCISCPAALRDEDGKNEASAALRQTVEVLASLKVRVLNGQERDSPDVVARQCQSSVHWLFACRAGRYRAARVSVSSAPFIRRDRVCGRSFSRSVPTGFPLGFVGSVHLAGRLGDCRRRISRESHRCICSVKPFSLPCSSTITTSIPSC
jgi:hypothetical protein